MKLRKLFAGIAAAATLLGGMALGATSAQAVRLADATFTFTAETAEQLTHANLTAYRIGDYYQLSAGCYGVITNDANKNAVDSALASALGADAVKTDQDNLAAALSIGALDISATRPWTTTADGAASATRAFANTLESEGKLTSGQQVTLTPLRPVPTRTAGPPPWTFSQVSTCSWIIRLREPSPRPFR